MKDPRKIPFGPYLRCLADKMGLRDWTVGIDHDPPEDANAKVDCRYGRKLAWVQISEAFLASSPEEQRQTLVHELIHAHFAAMNQLIYDLLGTGEYKAYKIPMEYAVDGVAEEWAKHLPLPNQVKDRKIPRKLRRSS